MPEKAGIPLLAPAAAGKAAPDKAGKPLPRWSLDGIYEGFNSPSYLADKKKLTGLIKGFRRKIAATPRADAAGTGRWLLDCVAGYNAVADLFEHLSAFAYVNYSTNTRDKAALAELNELEEAAIPLHTALVDFRNSLAAVKSRLPAVYKEVPALKDYRYFFKEGLVQQQHQMPRELEELAADLSRSGGDAWGRLQQSISSTVSMPWGKGRKTVVQLRTLAYDEDRNVREKAYNLELEAWKAVEIPLAAAMNGVKGFTVALDRRRGYETPLERAVFQSRISRTTLDTLISVITKNLPVFRDYLRLKAKILGIPKLAFYDLFAPVAGALGSKPRRFTFPQAAAFIAERLSNFSGEVSGFVEEAVSRRWIDAEPREGKVGGAYCIDFPGTKESRVLMNFEGTIYSVTTLAHELGHAYHHHVLKDEPAALRSYPMTLAETASIFTETLVVRSALEMAGREEKIALIENFLQDATQVLVDILSRFLFEQEVFTRRARAELSPEELCEAMLEAQRKTYGDGLDLLHPYMWAVKGHYYSQDRAFYNFPYAFGQLFGLGLYARYQETGTSFAPVYNRILRDTGRMSATDVTRRAGFDIEKPAFWQASVDVVKDFVKELEGLVGL